MNLSREELVALWQSLELAIATTRVGIDMNPQVGSKKLTLLKTLADKVQSELRLGDRMGWDSDRKSGAV